MNNLCVLKKVSLLIKSLVMSESLLCCWKLLNRRGHPNILVKPAASRLEVVMVSD